MTEVLKAVKAVEALEAALNSLDSRNIAINIASDVKEMTAELKALQTVINSLHGKDINIGINQITKDLGAHAQAVSDVTQVVTDHIDVTGASAQAMNQEASALDNAATALKTLTVASNEATDQIIAFGRANAIILRNLQTVGDTAHLAAAGIRDEADAANRAFDIRQFGIANAELLTVMGKLGAVVRGQQGDIHNLGIVYTGATGAIARFAVENRQALASLETKGPSTALVTDSLVAEAALMNLVQHYSNASRQIAMANGEAAVSMGTIALQAYSWRKMIMSFGNAWLTIAHWVFMGGSELLAVAVPALVALGAAIMVALQGAMNATQHFQALYTATEATANMFHQTVGTVLGLRSALQQAQDKANPGVYEILGGAINILKGNFQDLAGTGLSVIHVFDRFTARVVADFQAGMGGTIHSLLSGMIHDLTIFGQILGNIGHAILNFAAAMPGLAPHILGAIDVISKLILWISQLPRILITVTMGFEEFYRWGGLVATVIAALALGASKFISSFFGIPLVLGRVVEIAKLLMTVLPAMVAIIAGNMTKGFATLAMKATGSLGEIALKLGTVTSKVAGFAGGLVQTIAEMDPWKVFVGTMLVAAIGIFIYKLLTAQSASQQWANTLIKGIDSIQNGLKVPAALITGIAESTSKLTEAQAQYNRVADGTQKVINYTHWGNMNVSLIDAAGNVNAFSNAQKTLMGQLSNFNHFVTQAASTLHTSFIGAIMAANQAGVKWSDVLSGNKQKMDIAILQVSDLAAGYRAMGAPMNAVGADMNALAIQSGLTTTKVQQLNQAWDQFMQTLTGGTSSLAGLTQSIANIGHVTSQSTALVSQRGTQMSMSVSQIANSLKHFSGTSSQVWQNFNNTLTGSAQQLVDWMRTAGAMGAATGPQLEHTIADIVNALIPMASKSKVAQSELMGLWDQSGHTATSFGQLKSQVAALHPSMSNLNANVVKVTENMANMSQDAKKLGTVIQNDVIQTMGKAALTASKLGPEILTLDQDLVNGASASKIFSDKQAVASTMTHILHMSLKQANQLLGVNASELGNAASVALVNADANHTLNSVIRTGHIARSQFNTDIRTVIGNVPGAAGLIDRLSQMVAHNTQTTAAGRSVRQQLIKDFEAMGLKASTSKQLVHDLIGVMHKIPHNELLRIIMQGSGHYKVYGFATSAAGAQARSFAGHIHGPRATGGMIHGPGTGTSDSILAHVSNGEYVVRAAAVSHYGKNMMDAINTKKFATGGYVNPGGVDITGNRDVVTGAYAVRMYQDFQNQMLASMITAMRGAMSAAERASFAAGAPAYGSASQAMRFAMGLLGSYGWGNQWGALYNLWMRESGWNPYAVNASSGAYGIPQSLGHGHPYNLGDYANQIRWGLSYIRGRYGSPAAAWAHEVSYGWYDKGGWLMPGVNFALNTTGRPERVVGPGDNGPVHIHLNLDGQSFAEAVLPHLQKGQWVYDWRNSGQATYLKPR